jgi:serine/threonine-protein kinase
MQLTDALHYLHTRTPPVVYRDMKPANVMVKPDGDVKLIDFGIARTYKERNLADTTILGTFGYAPPEQFGSAQTDVRADIYSLGATLYHAVVGTGPGRGEAFIIRPIRDINPELSGGLEKIIIKCTRQDPKERYQNCSELMYDLDHYREIDDAFLSRQKAKLRNFTIIVVLCILFISVGISALAMSAYVTNSSYEQNIAWATSSTGAADKIGYYRQAADIKPLEEEPYLGIVNVIKADTAFSLAEEKELINTITPKLARLRQTNFYPRLAFAIGKLYWYYYDYGQTDAQTLAGTADTAGTAGAAGAAGAAGTVAKPQDSNQSTRMKSSVRWFADVLQFSDPLDPNYHIAEVFHDIGKFNDEIATSIAEADDSGKYKPYWDRLSELQKTVEGNDNEPEIVRLTLDTIVLDAICGYARKFKADGVYESEMEELRERSLADAQGFVATTDRTVLMQERIAGLLAEASDKAIDNAFRTDRDYRDLQYEQ